MAATAPDTGSSAAAQSGLISSVSGFGDTWYSSVSARLLPDRAMPLFGRVPLVILDM
jgi:hypothetical protein